MIRGQGYDGAANMSGETSGLQARVKAVSPRAAYVHCASHCLNLVIMTSSKLQPIRNMTDKLKAVSLYF